MPAQLARRSMRLKCLIAASTTFMAVSILPISPSTRMRSDEGFKSFDLLMLRELATSALVPVLQQRLGDTQAHTTRCTSDDGNPFFSGSIDIHNISAWWY